MPERGMNVLRGGRLMDEFMDVMVASVDFRYTRYVAMTSTTFALLASPKRSAAHQIGGQRRDQQCQ